MDAITIPTHMRDTLEVTLMRLEQLRRSGVDRESFIEGATHIAKTSGRELVDLCIELDQIYYKPLQEVNQISKRIRGY